eukprot:CAMPEP_0197038638 /NCGR_PEP_ID=MMETSP1384-20130603/15543_1 /TAXON_ID=29189 /ORGANISM="Ammonia sp." /LENGTH=245 /DNA_ID=CAMNT_0042469099 /DNA_START=86 /DNA_END=823 /DNA_ORIENTATION=-
MAEQDKKEKEEEAKAPQIVLLYHSVWGHIRTMAEEVEKGLKASGCDVKVYQIQETLPDEVIKAKMYGTLQKEFADKHPVLTRDIMADVLTGADGLMFGISTRFGMMSAQVKTLFDGTAGLWYKAALAGKPASIFFSSNLLGGGQETTALTAVTQLTHHGMIFVPMGPACKELMNTEEVHGGSIYGAGCIAGADGKRQVSDLEKRMAQFHGTQFGGVALKLWRGSKHATLDSAKKEATVKMATSKQ